MGSSVNQPTQAAGGASLVGSALAGGARNTGGAQSAVMPPSFGGQGARNTGGAQSAVMPPQTPQQPEMVQPTGPNIFQQSSGALNQAQQTLGGLAQFQPQAMQTAQLGPASQMQAAQVGPAAQMQAAQVGPAAQMQGVGQTNVGQLGTTDIGKYMSPYTQQVIERGEQDIARQRERALNTLGVQAGAAGAFGGSRQGIAEGETYGQYGRMAADFAANQRQQAFQQAQQAAQYDIGLRNQAAEAAAAREQAARSGNVAAANQFALQQAQLEQQAAQFNPQAANQIALQQAQLEQQAAQFNPQAANQFALQQAQLQQQANQATFGGQFQGAGVRQGAASGLAGLGQQQFNMGQAIQQQQAQQGAVQRGIMQNLIGAGQQNFGQYTGAPTGGLNTLLGALTGAGVPSGQTESFRPGFLNYLQAAAMF